MSIKTTQTQANVEDFINHYVKKLTDINTEVVKELI